MDIEDVQNSFSYLHQWLKEKHKLTEPTLSQVAASLVQSHVLAKGLSIKIKSSDPLEVGFVSHRADGELSGTLDLNVHFNSSLIVESEG